MKRALAWIFPRPFLTLVLVVVWALLEGTLSPGMLVFGLILGVVIPWITAPWWPDAPRRFHPGLMAIYIAIVLWDSMVANLQVAWIVLSKPNAKLRPAWVIVPLDLHQPEAITLLAGTVTLTPGTVSADLSDSGRSLLVHALHSDDPDAIRDDIKHRYERRLKEIFA